MGGAQTTRRQRVNTLGPGTLADALSARDLRRRAHRSFDLVRHLPPLSSASQRW